MHLKLNNNNDNQSGGDSYNPTSTLRWALGSALFWQANINGGIGRIRSQGVLLHAAGGIRESRTSSYYIDIREHNHLTDTQYIFPAGWKGIFPNTAKAHLSTPRTESNSYQQLAAQQADAQPNRLALLLFLCLQRAAAAGRTEAVALSNVSHLSRIPTKPIFAFSYTQAIESGQ